AGRIPASLLHGIAGNLQPKAAGSALRTAVLDRLSALAACLQPRQPRRQPSQPQAAANNGAGGEGDSSVAGTKVGGPGGKADYSGSQGGAGSAQLPVEIKIDRRATQFHTVLDQRGSPPQPVR